MQLRRVRWLTLNILIIWLLAACVGMNQPRPSATPLLPAQIASLTPSATTTVVVITPDLVTPAVTPTTLEETAGFSVCSPLEIHPLEELPQIISDPYHPPPMGKDDRHQGVDFSYYERGDRSSIQGVVVQSVLPGTVAASLKDSFPFGNLVIIETPGSQLPDWLRARFGFAEGESLYILYAHLDQAPLVELGQAVQERQPLGQVGKSGNAGIAHLHLETRIGPAGIVFPVMGYYLAGDTPEEQENYLLWRTSGAFRHFDPMQLLTAEVQP